MRVLVADDDPEILSLLRRALASEGYAVDTAEDGESALDRALHSSPDLVLLDVMMPGLDGIEVARRLRAVRDVPILLLTARGAVADRLAGLDAGADDYITKPFYLDELLARVRAHLRRCRPEEGEVLRFGDLSLNTASHEVRRGDRLIDMTPKEFNMLQLFLRHPHQVLTRDLVHQQVWGHGFGGASNIVEVNVHYLRRKLEGDGRPRLLHTVRGAGYMLNSR